MPKRVFWPLALIIMGTVVLAANLRLLPIEFYNLWPLILIIVGLGGLLLSDREDWNKSKSGSGTTTRKTAAKKSTAIKKTTKKSARSKKK